MRKQKTHRLMTSKYQVLAVYEYKYRQEILCVSRIVAFIVKKIDTIFVLHFSFFIGKLLGTL